jgi:hypothetical protein
MAVIVILAIFYYLFIGLKYFREEIKAFFNGKLTKDGQKAKATLANAEITNDPSFDEMQLVAKDLRYSVMDRLGKQTDKSQLLLLLQSRLAKYEGLNRPAYRVAINNSIILDAKEICGVAFSDDELNAAWDALPR